MKKISIGKDGERDRIKIIEKTRPYECGGTDAYRDTKAPKTIKSTDMVLFDVTTSMKTLVPDSRYEGPRYTYISAFAVPCGKGTFLFLEKDLGYYGDSHAASWAAVEEDAMPELVKLAAECGFAGNNGMHSTTHGLPENFGGSVKIEYASGEKISYSDNQCPLFGPDTAQKIDILFTDIMGRGKMPLPDISDLREIRFRETRRDGGFTEAVLELNPDGTGTNRKTSRYGESEYRSEKPVDAGTVSAIKDSIGNCGMMAWAGLPKSDCIVLSDKSLTFVFGGSEPITIGDDRCLPQSISRGFFSIELEMATKH